MGFTQPTTGTAYVEGFNICGDMDRIYTLMGVCPQAREQQGSVARREGGRGEEGQREIGRAIWCAERGMRWRESGIEKIEHSQRHAQSILGTRCHPVSALTRRRRWWRVCGAGRGSTTSCGTR